MIEIRRARLSDAEALASLSADVQTHHADAIPQLFKAVGPATFPPAAVRELLDEKDRIVLVACAEKVVVGYASAQIQRRAETPFRHAVACLCIQWMGVLAGWRRKGVGRALIDALRVAAAEHGLALVTLDVWSFNTNAYAFYTAVGFHPQRHILSMELET